jgi:hypothetical protein
MHDFSSAFFYLGCGRPRPAVAAGLLRGRPGLAWLPPEFAGKPNTKTISTSTNKKASPSDSCPQREPSRRASCRSPPLSSPRKSPKHADEETEVPSTQPSRSTRRRAAARALAAVGCAPIARRAASGASVWRIPPRASAGDFDRTATGTPDRTSDDDVGQPGPANGHGRARPA